MLPESITLEAAAVTPNVWREVLKFSVILFNFMCNKFFLQALPKPQIKHNKFLPSRYLDVVQPLLTKEEFEETKSHMEELVNGDGMRLQEYLTAK